MATHISTSDHAVAGAVFMAGIGHNPSGNFSAVRLLRDMDGDGAETGLEGR